MDYKLRFPPSSVKPFSQYSLSANIGPVKTGLGDFSRDSFSTLKDNFNLTTWILLGCVVQSLLILASPYWSLAAIPAFALVTWRIVDALLIHLAWKQNTYMRDVMLGTFSAAFPAPGEGTAITDKPGENGPGAIMLLGARSNSALGMFAPGFKEVDDRFTKMMRQLEASKENNGFMNMTAWLGRGARSSSNELATISYWRSVEDIHKFADSPVHREAMTWWSKNISKHDHIGLMHEIYQIPKHQGFEGIYLNYHPTGLAATTRLVNMSEKGDGRAEWINPIIDAVGAYKYSRGRMARDQSSGSSDERAETGA